MKFGTNEPQQTHQRRHGASSQAVHAMKLRLGMGKHTTASILIVSSSTRLITSGTTPATEQSQALQYEANITGCPQQPPDALGYMGTTPVMVFGPNAERARYGLLSQVAGAIRKQEETNCLLEYGRWNQCVTVQSQQTPCTMFSNDIITVVLSCTAIKLPCFRIFKIGTYTQDLPLFSTSDIAKPSKPRQNCGEQSYQQRVLRGAISFRETRS